MESIKALVQVLVVIVVLAVFIEMLLPSGHMQGYVKMVMGLVVIVVVLEAGAGLLQQNLKFELPALSSGAGGPSLDQIMNDGQKLAGGQKKQAMEEYRQGLEKQVLAIAKLHSGLNVTGAKIQTTDNPQDRNYGKLTGVVLEVANRETAPKDGQITVDQVKPVDITVNATQQTNRDNPQLHNKQANDLARTVADFYNLPLDQVKVVTK